jgi:hypothetical protein
LCLRCVWFWSKVLSPQLAANATVTALTVNGKRPGLGSQGGAVLGDALRFNLHLRELELYRVGAEAVLALAPGLGANGGLRALSLTGRQALGRAGGEALGRALAVNDRLETLDLNGCALGPAGLQPVLDALLSNASGALTSLDLRDNRLGHAGGEALGGFLAADERLRTLRASGNGLGDGLRCGVCACVCACTLQRRYGTRGRRPPRLPLLWSALVRCAVLRPAAPCCALPRQALSPLFALVCGRSALSQRPVPTWLAV